MMKNRLIRKYATIAVMGISVALFLPEALLAQGAVVGYANGSETGNVTLSTVTSFPTNSQLEKLTHVIARRIRCAADGNLTTETLPNYWNGSKPVNNIWNYETNSWLASLVERAHEMGVKVSIGVTGSAYFNAAISNHLSTLVNNIVKFVNHYGFDGVDINWEYPDSAAQWFNCIDLLDSLKNRPELQCKRISMVLPANTPTSSRYCNQTPPIPQQIWEIVDAIHLMTYNEWSGWPSHTHAGRSNSRITRWAEWGDSISIANSVNLSKNKLFVGSAFYGRNAAGSDVSYKDSNLGTLWSNPGDTQNDVKSKVDHCYDNGYGGVMIWELGHDIPDASDSTSLLYATWAANTLKGGYPDVTITTQPAATTNVVQGSISGNLSVLTNKPCIDVIYQWYKNTINSITGGTAVPGATEASFPIPTNLTAGQSPYYYYCVVKGKNTETSKVATVTVTAPPAPPVISGYSLICASSPKSFSASNWQSGNYYWDKSSNLSLSSPVTNSSVTVSANGTGAGWVSVKNNSGTELVRYTVWVGTPIITDIDGPDCVLNYTTGYYQAFYYSASMPTSFEWSLSGSPSSWYSLYSNNGFMNVYFNIPPPNISVAFYITLSLYNACGTSTEFKYITASNNCSRGGQSYSSYYPNPVKDILTVEINDEVAQAMLPAKTNSLTFDVRLYDGQGNLLRNAKTQGGTVEFNVASLLNGIYYLHVYDGVNRLPEIHQIMVEH